MAQRVRIAAPIGAIGPSAEADDDVGIPVQMFENPNLDRYLRNAQGFLDQQNYVAAIEVLQDVIQGRTIEFLGSAEEHAPPGDIASASPAKPDKPAAELVRPKDNTKSPVELDAANSVFSQDGRLYRPVRRLCHELLADMPSHAIELYRTLHEVTADEMFRAAVHSGSVSELEQVVNRYFITIPAGRAMVVLADRFMHEGRYRAAVQVLRDLIEIYPKENLKRAGADAVWCKFKIALCLRMAGEPQIAQEAVRALAADHPQDSLRILGELQSVNAFPEMKVFAADVLAMVGEAMADRGPSWFGPKTDQLIPLWQYRFVDPDPYRNPKSAKDNNNRGWGNDGQVRRSMPYANRYGPASWLRFVPGEQSGQPPRALFLDHFRLRVADARTGLLLREGDGIDAPSKPRDGHPRIRIAASDHALLRPIEDEERRYVVLGHPRATSENLNVLKASELVAYDRQTMKRAWDSSQWLDGDAGLREVTFLSSPTVFGERLLLPAKRKDAYSLECLDRKTGRPLWHTMLHAGGTPFFKAPGSPARVVGGTAFVITNAGCLAAVDAFAGDLRWIRRYEREDPLRPTSRPKGSTQQQRQYGVQFIHEAINGFLPNDLIVANGLVIMAPCDGGMLLAVDGASGEPVWMLDAQTSYAPYGKLTTIVGADGTNLFATSAKALVCIGLRGGLVRWMKDLPPISGSKHRGRGRGAVIGDSVLIPGEREILAFDTAGQQPMRRLRLSTFGVGPEPLQGPFNIVSSGPWLGIGYQGGVEVFSSTVALRDIAAETDDLWSRAGYLVSAGDKTAAEKVLIRWVKDPTIGDENHRRGCRRLLSLVRERGMELAGNGHLPEAIRALDDIGSLCGERQLRLGWHLARVEVCKLAGDLRAHENEQQRLYDYMEGKG